MIDLLGYTAGLLAMSSFLPQVLKTIRTKRVTDLSMFMLLLTLATNVLCVIYGVLLRLYPIIIMIGVMSGIVLVQIVLTLKYSKDATEEPG
jgi:MtN3 and saliva related transmembrane protein